MLELRLAVPADAEEIVEIARGGVPRNVLPYTLFAASGAVAFVRDRLAAEGAARMEAVVATRGGELDGFSAFGHVGEVMFLNHVYVREGRQGGGIGARLLRAGLERFRRPGETTLALDVFADVSTVAARWYAALGLAPISTADWHLLELPAPAPAAGWAAVGLEAADASLARYGMGELAIERGAGARHALGLIGRTYRSRAPALVADGAALAFLASLGRGDSLVCFAAPEEHAAQRPARPTALVARSTRMSGSMDVALERTAAGAARLPAARTA